MFSVWMYFFIQLFLCNIIHKFNLFNTFNKHIYYMPINSL